METISIELISEDADVAEVDFATRVLWGEMSTLQDVSVNAASTLAPLNAKSATAGAISTLALTILGSHGLATMLSSVLRDWLTRYHTFKIKVKRGSSVVEIGGVNPSDIDSLLPKLENLLR